VILLVLIALAARVDAAPDEASIALAVRYADLLTGDDAGDRDEPDEPDEPGETGEAEQAGFADLADLADVADQAGEATDLDVPSDADPGDPAPGASASWDPEPPRAAASEPLAYGAEGARGDPADDLTDDDPAGDDAPTGSGDPAAGGAGSLAMLDAEQAPGDAMAQGDASLAAAPAGASEAYEAWMRQARPPHWGRLDLGLTGRRLWSEPMHAPPHRSLEVWLVATWRR
jgi:hypothetical protein